jgi:hypothetical protein
LLEAVQPTPWGFGLARLPDIAAMKLEAIGSRKDFVDLYVLCRTFTLVEVFRLAEAKYRGAGYDRYHWLRSLAYFADAEAQPMPEMVDQLSWSEVRRFFEAEVPALWERG